MHKKLTGMMVAVLLLTAGLAAIGCPSPREDTITIVGGTAIVPISEKIALAFMEKHPGVTVHVAGGGSTFGITSVGDGIADIGNSSRSIRPDEKERWPELIAHTIAHDGIVLVVHPDNIVTDMTKEQIRGIFAGEITCWAEVGGDPGAVVVLSREEGSGTRAVFGDRVMDDLEITLYAILKMSHVALRIALAGMPAGIGYISYPFVDPTVTGVAIAGVVPTMENLRAGYYPLVRSIYKVTMGEPTGLVQDFFDFVLSPEGQRIVEGEGFIPVR